jgi:hypothetical protein
LSLIADDARAVADPAQGEISGVPDGFRCVFTLRLQPVQGHLRDRERHPRRIIEGQAVGNRHLVDALAIPGVEPREQPVECRAAHPGLPASPR